MKNGQWMVIYTDALDRYSLQQLITKPDSGGWSLSQLYDHLILAALDYLDVSERCAALQEEQPLDKTEFGEELYRLGGFPDIRIQLPEGFGGIPDNSGNIERIRHGLQNVSERMNAWESKLAAVNPNLKLKHDGFGWLNAREWFELAGMHFRHHLRQKAELDRLLGIASHD
ncbi:DinB family protein [Paenibacillus kobensis]|uniref:DinB family protein n=1 Tax=Paenibacillus kobensis TaxID=59841 RepID=UPI000FDCAA83|nr:DinB family protein [Paenibacillus kobensis]